MYNPEFKNRLVSDLEALKAAGLFKQERYIDTKQYSEVGLKDGSKVINMCANNYLGLANSPVLMQAAKDAIDRWGYGMASVRFICGTQTLHQQLEERLSAFLGTEDTILFGSCFDANGGLFEGLLSKEDAIISDSLNHASIIDGVRLCKAARYRYANNDMADLEAKLQEAKAAGARTILISTDGVFSMDGIVASLDKIHELAENLEERENVLAVPNAALRFTPPDAPPAPPAKDGKRIVWVLEDGKAHPRPIQIETGLNDGMNTEVVSGDLTPDMKVVTGSRSVTLGEEKSGPAAGNNPFMAKPPQRGGKRK